MSPLAQRHVILVRHGETENPADVVYGRLPRYFLTKDGLAQVRRTAALLKDQGADALLTSPLERAEQSAGIIGHELRLAPVVHNGLLEVLSEFEGLPRSEALRHIRSGRSGDLESHDAVARRVLDAIWDGAQTGTGHVIVVSHQMPIRLVAKAMGYLELRDLAAGGFHRLPLPDRARHEMTSRY